MVLLGQDWPAGGGYEPGHKIQIAFSGTMLNHQGMKNTAKDAVFLEDRAIFTSSENGCGAPGRVLFGVPENTGSHKTRRDSYGYIDGGSDPGGHYQNCCLSQPWKGNTLITYMMPAMQDTFSGDSDWDELLIYSTRWVEHGAWTLPDPYNRFPEKHGVNTDGGYRRSDLADDMWSTYRYADVESCTDQGFYCCPASRTCSSPRSGTGCSGTCCASSAQCTTGPVCDDGTCEGSETCTSCPEDCLHTGEVCCSGVAYSGDCCSDAQCIGSDTCENHVCTSTNPVCDDGTCEGSETCTSCPEDCLHNGQVCCSGVAYNGNCCDISDCSGSDTCENRVCTGPTPTCQNQNYDCCDSCQSGAHTEYDSDCSSQVCCETCTIEEPDIEIIIDNLDSGFSTTGNWWASGYPNPYGSNALGSDVNVGSVARWTPNIQEAGQYQVYAWWTQGVGRANDAQYTINNHVGGSDTVTVNQKQNGGQWNLLGTYSFNAGTNGFISVSDESTDPNYVPDEVSDSVCADAVRFVRVGGGCNPAHAADNNPCNNEVSMNELIAYINRWINREVSLNQVVEAIVAWKN